MKKNKFTFKTTKATGRFRSFSHDTHDIKLNNKIVGQISDAKSDIPFDISLIVKKNDINSDGNPNCVWKWIRLKKKSNSLQEAKDFLNEHVDSLLAKYNLFPIE